MIKTKSIYEPPAAEDGKRILVMRWLPKAFIDERRASGISAALSLHAWMVELSPGVALLTAWQRGKILWPRFVDMYLEEMKMPTPVRLIQDLAALAGYGDITLLCAEAEQNPRCHRHLLKKLIDDQIAAVAQHALTGE